MKIQERYDHGVGVATYLARYLKGGPIGNSRLVSMHGGRVYFRCRVTGSEAESGRGRKEMTSLEVDKFLRRLLEHVPPKGFHTVRGYGLYASNQRERLNAARSLLSQQPVANPLPAPPSWQEFCEQLGHAETARCPHCGSLLQSHSHFGRGRSPPWPFTDLPKRGAA